MSDANGPYTLNEDDAGRYVISDMPSHLATFESHLDASVAVLIANYAHHHALAAQAERVKKLEEALGKAVELLDGCVEDHNFDFGCEFDQIKTALTPPAKGGSDANG